MRKEEATMRTTAEYPGCIAALASITAQPRGAAPIQA